MIPEHAHHCQPATLDAVAQASHRNVFAVRKGVHHSPPKLEPCGGSAAFRLPANRMTGGRADLADDRARRIVSEGERIVAVRGHSMLLTSQSSGQSSRPVAVRDYEDRFRPEKRS